MYLDCPIHMRLHTEDSPYSPSYGTLDGSCGYGLLQQNQYPFWAVAGLATANHYYSNEPLHVRLTMTYSAAQLQAATACCIHHQNAGWLAWKVLGSCCRGMWLCPARGDRRPLRIHVGLGKVRIQQWAAM